MNLLSKFSCLFLVVAVAAQAQFGPVGSQLDGNAPNDNFGWSVALNDEGRIMAVGAPLFDEDFGQVRVYQEVDGTWMQIGSDIEGTLFQQIGFSVALNAAGNRLAVGGIGGSGGGLVQVFDLTDSEWSQVGEDLVGSAGDQVGASIDLSADGNRLIIAARNAPGPSGGARVGRVQAYELDGASWTELGSALRGEDSDDKFGSFVSLSSDGNTMIVAALGDAGYAKVFGWSGSDWAQIGDNIPRLGNESSNNQDVSISDDGQLIAVSSPLHDHGAGFGSVQTYRFDDGTWAEVGRQIRGSSSEEAFGQAVVLSGDGKRLAIGTQSADDVDLSSGRVNVYALESDDWIELYEPITGTGQFDNLGHQIAMNTTGTRMAIGANLANSTQGYVTVIQDSQMPVNAEAPAPEPDFAIWWDGMHIRLQSGTTLSGDLRIFNALGQHLTSVALTGYEVSFRYDLPPGLYLTEASTRSGTYRRSLLIR